MIHSPQNCQATQLIKPITFINGRCPARLCFLCQEPCGSQCHQGPLYINLPDSIHLYLQIRLHVLCRLFLYNYCLHYQPSFTYLFFFLILRLIARFFFSPPHGSFPSPFPYSVACPPTTASRPAHSWRFPHAIINWYPAALIRSSARAKQSVFPIPIGRTPGLLFSTTIQKVISAR